MFVQRTYQCIDSPREISAGPRLYCDLKASINSENDVWLFKGCLDG